MTSTAATVLATGIVCAAFTGKAAYSCKGFVLYGVYVLLGSCVWVTVSGPGVTVL